MADLTQVLEKNSIIIGGVDIVKQRLDRITLKDDTELCDDTGVLDALEDIKREMRVRIGTMLKTDNVSFLFGAGASKVAGGILLGKIPNDIEKELLFRGFKGGLRLARWLKLFYEIISKITSSTDNAKGRYAIYQKEQSSTDDTRIPVNFEELLSHICMLFSAVNIYGYKLILKEDGQADLVAEKKHLVQLKNELVSQLVSQCSLPKSEISKGLETHIKFVKKILTRPLNLRRANIFTLNYDTLIEQASDASGVVLVDGFIGNVKRVFRPESYDLDFYFPAQTTEGRVHRFDRALHLYKLHGSINWYNDEQSWENPYGLTCNNSGKIETGRDVIIYPSPLKYGQTLGLPYSELFRRFCTAISQPQSVLFVIGYGFGDDHVNALIHQSLAIPSFTLVIVDPYPGSSFVNKLIESKDERVIVIKGSEFGDFTKFTEDLLPDIEQEDVQIKVTKTYNALKKINNSGTME